MAVIGLLACNGVANFEFSKIGDALSPTVQVTACEKVIGYIAYTCILTFIGMFVVLIGGGIMYIRKDDLPSAIGKVPTDSPLPPLSTSPPSSTTPLLSSGKFQPPPPVARPVQSYQGQSNPSIGMYRSLPPQSTNIPPPMPGVIAQQQFEQQFGQQRAA